MVRGEQIEVTIPRELLEQILDNLIDNAIEASPEHGIRVVVEVEKIDQDEERWCYIRVKDNGNGVPEEIRDRIFTPFVTTKPAGAGLGLPICYKIIKRYDGDINYIRKEGWSVFEIQLPCV